MTQDIMETEIIKKSRKLKDHLGYVFLLYEAFQFQKKLTAE